MTDSASIEVRASRGRVWELVSDVSNYGKWSPENRESVWLGENSGPQIGAWFEGRNRKWIFVWSTKAEVTECVVEHVFEFVTYVAGRRSTYWRYELEEIPGGVRVTESYEVLFSPFRPIYRLIRRREDLKRGIEETLARLKESAEGGTRT